MDVDNAVEQVLKAKPHQRLFLRRERRRGADQALRARPRRAAHSTGRGGDGEPRRAAPVIHAGKPGIALDLPKTRQRIEGALAVAYRPVLRPVAKTVAPTVTRSNFGAVVVIYRGSNVLHLYRGDQPWRTIPVATGQAIYPTPTGAFSVVDKQRNPWWRPPNSEWAKGLKPVPPGPGNPLGTRWMGISAPGVGMHGTPDAASIGYSASHGASACRSRTQSGSSTTSAWNAGLHRQRLAVTLPPGMKPMVVTSIQLYPVKSLAGLGVPEGEVEPWGLRRTGAGW